MRICTKCGNEKLETEFFWKDKSKGKLHSSCKDCYAENRKTYTRNHYLKYGDLYRERARNRNAQYKRDIRLKMVELMANKSCSLCPESELCALDFDHIDPMTKSFGIAAGIRNGYSWETILAEIQKCRILCANCHRKRTAKQASWYKNIGI